jgi:uncharacterized protein YuzE/virulence-associated protein VapD
MVAKISEVAAKSGNVKVFKWALWNEYFHEEYWDDDVFVDIAENGHIKILELADKKEGLDCYSRDILVDAADRNDWELLDFLLKKIPNEFNLSFTKMCVREGFIEVVDWWKEVELIELIKEAAYSGQRRMQDNLYNNEYQQASSDLKEFLREMIVNWAASAGQIEVAAKSGNVKVFQWALWNEYFHEEYWDDDIFVDVAENGHIKILELADTKEGFDWYSRAILVDAVARNNWELLDFLLQKKPNQFDLSFTKMCVREGFIKVMDWWREAELIELIKEAAYDGQWRMLDNLYNNEYQQASSDLKEFLREMMVNWAASAGQIDVLE